MSHRLKRVCVTKCGTGHGKTSRYLHSYNADLPNEDVVELDGIRVTNLNRTVADLLRGLTFPEAVMIVDAAMTKGLDIGNVSFGIGAGRGHRRAIEALEFGDGRSESAGESRSRALMRMYNLPVPLLQPELRTEGGLFVARVDFLWPENRLVGEFDGASKYRDKAGQNETTAVVLREKCRENDIRRLGYDVIRWTWRELDDAATWACMIRKSLQQKS